MEKEYVICLRVNADSEEIEKYGSIEDMILETTQDVPFSFDIETVMEIPN